MLKLKWEYCECGCKCHTWGEHSIYIAGQGYFYLNPRSSNGKVFASFEDAEAEVIKETQIEIDKLQKEINRLKSMLENKVYIEVSQFNYTEKKFDANGRAYYSNYHQAPSTLKEAEEWSEKNPSLVKIIYGKSDEEVLNQYPNWGYGLYIVNDDGSIKLVKGDWDSSG